MNFHTAAEVRGQSIGLVTAIHDRESQTSKLVMDYVFFHRLLGKMNFQVILVVVQVIVGLFAFSCVIQHTPLVIH